jgi:hypothetical protein
MAVEAVKFNLFLSHCIYLFSFFLYPHLKMTGAQFVSYRNYHHHHHHHEHNSGLGLRTYSFKAQAVLGLSIFV